MKIAIVLSEFPKLTETFAYRNIVEYQKIGWDVAIFHNKPFRKTEVVHGFVRDLIPRAFTFGFLSPSALGALGLEIVTAPRRCLSMMGEIITAHWREPARGLAVAALLPKAMALGHWCRRNGVAHIHAEFAGHPGTVAMIAARLAGIPFSFTAHANDIFVSQALLATKGREAAFIRTISRYNMAYLHKVEGFPGEKLHLIRCGVPRAMLKATEPDPPDEGLRILYVGSLTEKKGVAHLLNALALLPEDLNWQARILGGGDLMQDLEAQASAAGLNERVHFEGPQPAEAVAEANNWAHLLVVPSVIGKSGRVEGIPVVVMEAMAHARPVIASALSGIPELVESDQTGWLVPPAEPRAIADAISSIAADWPRAAQIARAGRARISSEYQAQTNAHALAQLIEAHS